MKKKTYKVHVTIPEDPSLALFLQSLIKSFSSFHLREKYNLEWGFQRSKEANQTYKTIREYIKTKLRFVKFSEFVGKNTAYVALEKLNNNATERLQVARSDSFSYMGPSARGLTK